MPVILDQLKTLHDNAYPVEGVDFWLTLIDDEPESFESLANSASNQIATPAANGFVVDSRVIFSSSGVMPAPLLADTIYWVVEVLAANGFRVSEAKQGAPITLTSDGSGILAVEEAPLDESVGELSFWVNKEANVPIRKRYTPDPAEIDIDLIQTSKLPKQIVFDNTNGSSSITFDKALLIRGGSATKGDLTGTADSFENFGSTQVIAPGEIRIIRVHNLARPFVPAT